MNNKLPHVVIIKFQDEPLHIKDRFYPDHAPHQKALATDYPGVMDALALVPWTKRRPGVLGKHLIFPGPPPYDVRGAHWSCQDCGIEHGIVYMLKDSLWDELYPKNGLACPRCASKRLGRDITPDDLTPAPCNQDFLTVIEQWRV
jgi:DNA-directed RNA polymerase subunit RPC12/RpoP